MIRSPNVGIPISIHIVGVVEGSSNEALVGNVSVIVAMLAIRGEVPLLEADLAERAAVIGAPRWAGLTSLIELRLVLVAASMAKTTTATMPRATAPAPATAPSRRATAALDDIVDGGSRAILEFKPILEAEQLGVELSNRDRFDPRDERRHHGIEFRIQSVDDVRDKFFII